MRGYRVWESICIACDGSGGKIVKLLVRYPRAEARGLRLYSTATQKGDLSALASLYDTSESFDSGPSDKRPVLAHHGRTTCKQEALLSTKNVLPEHGILAQNLSVQLEKNPVGELSLSSEEECLSLHCT